MALEAVFHHMKALRQPFENRDGCGASRHGSLTSIERSDTFASGVIANHRVVRVAVCRTSKQGPKIGSESNRCAKHVTREGLLEGLAHSYPCWGQEEEYVCGNRLGGGGGLP